MIRPSFRTFFLVFNLPLSPPEFQCLGKREEVTDTQNTASGSESQCQQTGYGGSGSTLSIMLLHPRMRASQTLLGPQIVKLTLGFSPKRLRKFKVRLSGDVGWVLGWWEG